MVARTVIAPVERVKILYQIQRKGGADDVVAALAAAHSREEGVLACWKGNSAAITRVVPYMSVQFSFEKFKPMVGMAGGVASCGTTTNNVIAGSCAGLVAVMLTYPLDTVRARGRTAGGRGKGATAPCSMPWCACHVSAAWRPIQGHGGNDGRGGSVRRA